MKSVFLLIVLFAQINFVIGWGADGHRIVAQIASNMLTSAAQAKIAQMLPEGINITDIAPLVDDYSHTPQGNWSITCHYCNLPNNSMNFSMADCPACCVVKAIQNYTKILSNEVDQQVYCNINTNVEPCALEFLVHYVGDVHQPLHVGYGWDEGGNLEKVNWYGDQVVKLHHVWDTSMIDKWDGNYDYDNTSWSSVIPELEEYMQSNPNIVQHYAGIVNPIYWADESFYYVRTDVYNYNPNPVHNAQSKVASYPYLASHYYDHNLPIVKQRLIAGGIRLGTLLNSLLG